MSRRERPSATLGAWSALSENLVLQFAIAAHVFSSRLKVQALVPVTRRSGVTTYGAMNYESMSQEQLDRLIARYVGGEATPEETAQLDARMAADAALATHVDAMRRAWEVAGEARSPWDSRAAWQAVKGRVIQPASGDTRRVRPQVVRGGRRQSSGRRFGRRAWLLGRAAAVFLLVSAGGWWVATDRASRHAAEQPFEEIVTQRAQLGNVYLSDGTRVVLGVESKLRFTQSLGRSSRDVYLDGTALFEVERDTRRPFRVHTAHGVTEVLGTRFGVRAYATDSTTTVVVAEGRVALEAGAADGDTDGPAPDRASPDRSVVVLEPGDLGRLTAAGEIEKQRGVPVDRHLAWTERRLVFTDTPLREAIVELRRWYDLDIRIADASLEERRLTANLGNEPLGQMLQNLAIALEARVQREGQTITIESQ